MAESDLHQSDKLLRYALGDLASEEALTIAKHLTACDSCQDFVAFVTEFNGGLRDFVSDVSAPAEDHPDSSLIVGLEAGELQRDVASQVSAHVLFCKSCLEEFLCIRRLSQPEPWDLVEKLRDSLIDLGATYGLGALRGSVQIVSEGPALAFRGEGSAPNAMFKVIEATVGENTYSIEENLFSEFLRFL